MKADRLQLALRPRPLAEAADLGVRFAQACAASLRAAYLPLATVLVAACASTAAIKSWLPILLLWWAKPWLDRVLLQIYARQAFGEPTSLRQAWSDRAAARWAPLLVLLTFGRLSLQRTYLMPVIMLEGISGAARRARVKVLLREHRTMAQLMQVSFGCVETALILALLSLVFWAAPGLWSSTRMGDIFGGETAAALGLYAAYAAAVLFVEPFHAAAGFAMYLNRRVELEAWDVEQELRDAFAKG